MSDDRGAGPRPDKAPSEGAGRLGRYILKERLGRGGMAEVFLARRADDDSGRLFVVKRVLPHLADEQKFVSMFLREGRIVARIVHENVVQVLDLDQDKGAYFLAMEHLDGLSLHDLAKRAWHVGRSLPLELVVRAISDAALGLHAAHELRDDAGALVGLVHRDISPDNLFLTRTGVCKVLDFGIARDATETVVTETGEIKGKVPYMAPEQVEDEELDRRADIYALGVTLFWLLTGRRPFRGKNDHQTMLAITRDEPPVPSSLNPHVPPEIDAAIAKMLAKKRSQRPQTSAEVYELLEGFRGTAAQAPDRIAFINDMMNVPNPAGTGSNAAPAQGAAAPFGTRELVVPRPITIPTEDAELAFDDDGTNPAPGDAAAPRVTVVATSTAPMERPSTVATTTQRVPRDRERRSRAPLVAAAVAAVGVLAIAVVVLADSRSTAPTPPAAPPASDAGGAPETTVTVPVPPAEPPAPAPPVAPQVAPGAARVVHAKAPAHVVWQTAGGAELGRGTTDLQLARDERLYAVDTRRLVRTEVKPVDETADYARLPTGELSLRVAPYADMVWLGKEKLGPTPFSKPILVLTAGTYRARLRLKDREKTITIVVPPRDRVDVRVNMADP